MTNVVESLVAYTNVAFQLMFGHASAVSEHFNLPLPRPIAPQSVKEWNVSGFTHELNGSLTISNSTFFFDGGAFTGIGAEAISQDTRNITLAMQGQFAQNAPPGTMSSNEVVALEKSHAMLRNIGMNPQQLGSGFARYVPRSRQYWIYWHTNAHAARMGLNAGDERVVEFGLTPQLAADASLKKFLVDVPITTTTFEVYTNAIVVPCGTNAVTDDQARDAVAKCFDGLQRKLGSRRVQTIFVEDNLNRAELIASEVSRLGPNAVYISIDWFIPPAAFSGSKSIKTSEHRRGINMVAITGDVGVQVARAPFLRGRQDPQDSQKLERAREQAMPAANAFIQSLNIQAPPRANLCYRFPSTIGSLSRHHAFNEAAKHHLTLVNSWEVATPRRFKTFLNGEVRDDEPILLILTGAFETAARSISEVYTALAPLSGAIVFHENQLEGTYASLGPIGLKVLTNAKRVETFRLWLLSERDHRDVPGAKKINNFPIRQTGPFLNSAVKDELVNFLMREIPSMRFSKACIYDPGIAFRMTSPEGSISALVCFGCSDLSWTVHDRAEKVVAGGSVDPDDEMMRRLRVIGLKAFPGFRELRPRKGGD
jgi:hypothetical protein